MNDREECVSINVNGLVIHSNTGSVLNERALDGTIALDVLRACRTAGHPTVVYSGTRIIAREDNALARVLPSYHVCIIIFVFALGVLVYFTDSCFWSICAEKRMCK